jgi:hypothetical protein
VPLQPLCLNDLINKHTHTNSRQHINCSELFKQVQPKNVIQWHDAVQARDKNLSWMAQHAYDNQQRFGCTYTYQRLYDYFEDLVIKKTFNGLSKELKALRELKPQYPTLLMGIDERYDGTYGVDIYVGATKPQKQMLGGIQVKPVSYLNRPDDQALNAKKNQKYRAKFPSVKEVKYLYYEERGVWVNMKEVLDYLHDLRESIDHGAQCAERS